MSPQPAHKFVADLKTTFPTLYLTLVSIIQGVAVATLTFKAIEYLSEAGYTDVRHYAPILVSFVLTAGVTWEYSWYVALSRPPRLTDILIPLGVGIFEVLPTYYFNAPDLWCTSIVLMAISGIGAYTYSLRILPEAEIDVDLRSVLRRSYWQKIVLLVAAVVAFGGFSVAIAAHWEWRLGPTVLGSNTVLVTAWITALMLEAVVLFGCNRWLNRLIRTTHAI